MDWDCSQTYRTETWLQQANNKLTIPVCISSYNRPDAPIFSHLQDFNQNELYIFIRKEQRKLYKDVSKIGKLVMLPDWVYEIGTTREAIVQWAQQNNYSNIFMLDDRIIAVNYLVPKTAKTGKQSLTAPKQSLHTGLLVWEQILKRYSFTLSSPAHKGFSYYPENINKDYEINNGIISAAISINVKDLATHNLHYKPLDTCGGEDICLLLDVMKAGLPTCKITDLEYDEIPSDKLSSGGNHLDNTTQLQRSIDRLKMFWKSYLHLEYPQKHSYVYIRKTRDIPYPYIRWKYWKDYYENHKTKNIISTDLYHIPGDTGKPWRFYKMIEYIGNFPDEIGPIINAWFKANNTSNDDKVWWVFLYSACYCMGTAMLMSKMLDYNTITERQLEQFWIEHKSKLVFQSDRRYIKNMNNFTEMVKEFLSRTRGNLYGYISQFITDDPETTYNNLYNEVYSWKHYRRFGTLLFIFNLCKVFPDIVVDSKVYDWKWGATTTSAIFNARYEDERANLFEDRKSPLSEEDIQMLDNSLQLITLALQKYKPDKNWDIIHVSSDLCSYRKLFKGKRYQGFYVDRQQEEIQVLQYMYPEYQEIWDFVWESRQKYIDPKYLGEVNGWKGIRKNRINLFLDYGYVGDDPNFPGAEKHD